MSENFILEIDFFFLIKTYKIYSFSNFQIYNMVLSTAVTILCIIFPELVYFITESLYLLTSFIHFMPSFLSPASNKNQSVLCAYEIAVCLLFKILHISKIVQYLSSSLWFILLSVMSSSSIHILMNGRTFFIFMVE